MITINIFCIIVGFLLVFSKNDTDRFTGKAIVILCTASLFIEFYLRGGF